jgi:hypothetical protein
MQELKKVSWTGKNVAGLTLAIGNIRMTEKTERSSRSFPERSEQPMSATHSKHHLDAQNPLLVTTHEKYNTKGTGN